MCTGCETTLVPPFDSFNYKHLWKSMHIISKYNHFWTAVPNFSNRSQYLMPKNRLKDENMSLYGRKCDRKLIFYKIKLVINYLKTERRKKVRFTAKFCKKKKKIKRPLFIEKIRKMFLNPNFCQFWNSQSQNICFKLLIICNKSHIIEKVVFFKSFLAKKLIFSSF